MHTAGATSSGGEGRRDGINPGRMKRVRLILGIMMILFVAWANIGIWLSFCEPSATTTYPDGSVSFHRYHLDLLSGIPGAFLLLGMLGTLWLWHKVRISK